MFNHDIDLDVYGTVEAHFIGQLKGILSMVKFSVDFSMARVVIKQYDKKRNDHSKKKNTKF